MSFVCSWHLSQKELRLSTPLILLLERVGVKEREQEGARDRHRDRERERERERERTWEGNRRVKTKEVRCFTPAAGEGHVFKTQMCAALRYWSHSLLVIRGGHPDHEPTPSRLPVRNGAPTLQVEQGPSRGENTTLTNFHPKKERN